MISKQPNMGDVAPGQEEVDEAFFREVEESSCLQNMILMRNFNQPNTCWRDSTAGHRQSARFLECIDDNFQTQVTEELMMGGDLLDLRYKQGKAYRGCEGQGQP